MRICYSVLTQLTGEREKKKVVRMKKLQYSAAEVGVSETDSWAGLPCRAAPCIITGQLDALDGFRSGWLEETLDGLDGLKGRVYFPLGPHRQDLSLKSGWLER